MGMNRKRNLENKNEGSHRKNKKAYNRNETKENAEKAERRSKEQNNNSENINIDAETKEEIIASQDKSMEYEKTNIMKRKNIVETKEEKAINKEEITETKEVKTVTKEEIAETKEEKAINKEEIAETKEEKTVNKEEIADTKGEKAINKEEITETKGVKTVNKEEIMETKEVKTVTKEEIAETKEDKTGNKEENKRKEKTKTEDNCEITERKTENADNKVENPQSKKEIIEDKEMGTEEKRKSAKKTRKILIPIGIFLAFLVCCCTYVAIALPYQNKFLPGTWINGIECSELEEAQVVELIENRLKTYCLEVTGRNYSDGTTETLLGRITAEDIQLTYSENSQEAVNALLNGQNILTWAYRKLSDNTYNFQLAQDVSYDEELLKKIVSQWDACQTGNMSAPQDAYISDYSEKYGGYQIIPEVEGTKFDIEQLLELLDVAIISQEAFFDLEEENCYEEPSVRKEDEVLTEPVETVNKWLGAEITYDWNDTEIIIGKELLREWISMEKSGPVLDEDAVAAFVEEQAKEFDTYGKRRNFITTLGVELSLPSGYYGWLTDKEAETKELTELIYQGKVVSREPIYASTARQKGMSDIGSSYVEVDLTHQHLYLYEGGSVVFETDFVSGSMSSTPDCVTPEGVFGISYKTTNAVLRGANYVTPVNYWMPFYGNFGMHDATWRNEFGGQIYIENGSHGCVNLPLDAAAAIYEHMSTGFPVICYYYQVDPLADQNADEEWEDEDDDDDEE